MLAFLLVRQGGAVAHRPGAWWRCGRTNRSRAPSASDVTHYLVVATVISAGIAGAAGSLFAHYVRIIDPDVFLFVYTVTMVIMVVTGGKGTLWMGRWWGADLRADPGPAARPRPQARAQWVHLWRGR